MVATAPSVAVATAAMPLAARYRSPRSLPLSCSPPGLLPLQRRPSRFLLLPCFPPGLLPPRRRHAARRALSFAAVAAAAMLSAGVAAAATSSAAVAAAAAAAAVLSAGVAAATAPHANPFVQKKREKRYFGTL